MNTGTPDLVAKTRRPSPRRVSTGNKKMSEFKAKAKVRQFRDQIHGLGVGKAP